MTEAELEWERGFPERMANLRQLIEAGYAEVGQRVPEDSVAELRELVAAGRASSGESR
ncbi:MAG: hypothetical protein JO186_06240 [Actinobacteria bacterium]|nr:hypothetical protein [Actinomycetota bacterium]